MAARVVSLGKSGWRSSRAHHRPHLAIRPEPRSFDRLFGPLTADDNVLAESTPCGLWKSGDSMETTRRSTRLAVATLTCICGVAAGTVIDEMYRFLVKPKWIAFHLLVIGGIVGMIYLGFWQLERRQEKQTFNARVEQRYDETPVPLDDLLTASADVDDLEWRPVTISGTYVADESIQIVNRSQFGRAGENVVTPMRIDGGRVLLVNRGFYPLDVDPTPPPAGTVAVNGRLRLSQNRTFGQLGDRDDGVLEVAQRVDIERLSQQLDGEVVPMYVDVYESFPAEADPQPQPVIAPELTEGNHLSYAMQWFTFSIAVAVGWVLAVRRSIRTHRANADADALGPAVGIASTDGPPDAISGSDSGTPSSPGEAPVRPRRYTDR